MIWYVDFNCPSAKCPVGLRCTQRDPLNHSQCYPCTSYCASSYSIWNLSIHSISHLHPFRPPMGHGTSPWPFWTHPIGTWTVQGGIFTDRSWIMVTWGHWFQACLIGRTIVYLLVYVCYWPDDPTCREAISTFKWHYFLVGGFFFLPW